MSSSHALKTNILYNIIIQYIDWIFFQQAEIDWKKNLFMLQMKQSAGQTTPEQDAYLKEMKEKNKRR